ncbi:hypothetical protein [Gelidibacter maritimus]|uniref:Uncharacterized protein n=1 Tax=Gelidibacter maritimus TaxID=2761487 RepID=A0A7W2R253_9FLAO|nr:hypothetical protein [Gelidibacter maritimus]MBA6151422.1 hypothetical protein [Gelidibacter maritimus]
MKPTLLLGAASTIFRSRKAQIVLVGIQFGYLIYKLVQDKNERSAKRLNK